MIHKNFEVNVLGRQTVKSPLKSSFHPEGAPFGFIESDERVLYDASRKHFNQYREKGETPISFEKTGPHKELFFYPLNTKVAIVTCEELCPGSNNVIRSMVNLPSANFQFNFIIK